MIGIRSALAAVVAGVAICVVVGAGGDGPQPDLAARRLVLERAAAADAALAAVEAAVEPGVTAARSGAARVVTGDEPPGDHLRTAAEHVGMADPDADEARAALEALDGAVQAAGWPWNAPPALEAGELGSVAAQLSGTAGVADAFAEMRGRAEGLVETLEEALAALEDRDLGTARGIVERARADHDALAAWDVGLVTLPVWLDTTDAMIGAVEDIVAAAEAGDEAAARAAAEDFAALSEDAVSADRALRIAIVEGGADVTATPLGRLADALRKVAEARAAVASIVQTVGR